MGSFFIFSLVLIIVKHIYTSLKDRLMCMSFHTRIEFLRGDFFCNVLNISYACKINM